MAGPATPQQRMGPGERAAPPWGCNVTARTSSVIRSIIAPTHSGCSRAGLLSTATLTVGETSLMPPVWSHPSVPLSSASSKASYSVLGASVTPHNSSIVSLLDRAQRRQARQGVIREGQNETCSFLSTVHRPAIQLGCQLKLHEKRLQAAFTRILRRLVRSPTTVRTSTLCYTPHVIPTDASARYSRRSRATVTPSSPGIVNPNSGTGLPFFQAWKPSILHLLFDLAA
ncbi:hypothetical protein AAFF_G00433780 [Aldrovandia affinis]|uniref:Uncharacterized protein n=1 Tax=Aldrovandia affinis TaxID=143900 RepID=A0AAD7R3A8_9TELE|nr:hypothetical protein AAFF_G00433780 [Aldrovandia affinis]